MFNWVVTMKSRIGKRHPTADPETVIPRLQSSEGPTGDDGIYEVFPYAFPKYVDPFCLSGLVLRTTALLWLTTQNVDNFFNQPVPGSICAVGKYIFASKSIF